MLGYLYFYRGTARAGRSDLIIFIFFSAGVHARTYLYNQVAILQL